MCVCVCVKYNTYVHIYIYTHIYIHTHTHACRSDRLRSSTAREGESVSNCPEPPTRTPSLLRPFAHFPRSISPALTVPLPARQAGTQSMKGWLKGSLEGALEPPLEPPTHAPAARAHDAARAPRRVQHVRPPLLQGLQKQVCVRVCVCVFCVCVCVVCVRACVSYTCLHTYPLFTNTHSVERAGLRVSQLEQRVRGFCGQSRSRRSFSNSNSSLSQAHCVANVLLM